MLNVKPHRQKPGFCGPAALKMVLEYYGLKKTEGQLAKMTNCKPEKGITGAAIVKAAKKLGFSGFVKDDANLKDLQKYLKKEVPVIVEWFSEDEAHFSVAVKLDKEFIYLQDPELADIRKIDLETFKRIWFSFDSLFLRTKRDLVLRRMVVIEKKIANHQKRKLLFFLK